MKKVLFTLFIVLFAFSFSYTDAQVQSPIDGVTISSNPTNPAPGQTVKITVESFLFDLNSASIVWLSNGISIDHGIGMVSKEVKAPTLGKKVVISAVIKTNEGREIQKAIVLKSGSVDIIWEASGYVPPLFKGKNSFTYQNSIKLTAIPHLSIDGVTEIDPKKLVYQWKQEGKYIEGASGYGKQSVVVVGDEIPKNMEISLNVYTQDQSQSAGKDITITPTEPSINFYEIDPLYGVFLNKEIGSKFYMRNNETTIFSSPFGFDKINGLGYTWSINNIEQPNLVNKQSITLRTKGGSDGSSNIKLEMRSKKNILQGSDGIFTAIFKKKAVEEEVNTTF